MKHLLAIAHFLFCVFVLLILSQVTALFFAHAKDWPDYFYGCLFAFFTVILTAGFVAIYSDAWQAYKAKKV